MDTEFNINTQKGKNKLLGVVQTTDSLQTILRDRKNNTQLRGLPFQERKTIRQRNEKQWPAYNGVKKVFTPL